MTGDDPFYDRDPLAITGVVSDPRARTIDPRRFERRAPIRIAVLNILLTSACAWALIVMLVWAAVILAPIVWRLVEPLLTVLAVGLALVVIVLGIGLPG